MYNDDNSLEKFPGASPETRAKRSIPPEQDFEKNYAESGVPPFAGEQFGVARKENEFYGESKDDTESEKADNEGITNAASLINYGLDAVAREIGVEATVQGIKSFDASKSDNPIRDLYIHLGIDTIEELDDARDESEATKAYRERFRSEYNMPRTQQKTREGAIKAIQDMKELIIEVEGADPRYQELRDSAKGANKGYFEYAVKDFGLRGLTDLFGVLAEQRKKKEQEASVSPETQETQKETPEELGEDPLEASQETQEEPIVAVQETPAEHQVSNQEETQEETLETIQEDAQEKDTQEEDAPEESQEKDPRIVSGQE